jgi:hypothetical protein
MGKPMSAATHCGFSAFPFVSGKRAPLGASTAETVVICVLLHFAPLPSPSLAVGVGHSLPIARATAVPSPSLLNFDSPLRFALPNTVGVGHDEDSLSSVRSPDVGRRKRVGTGSIASSVEESEDRREVLARAAAHVLDDDEARPELSDDAGEVEPEAGASARETGAFPGSADVLTGEASADEIDAPKIGSGSCSDIRDAPVCIGPMPRENAAAPFVALNLPHHWPEPGPLEPKFQAPYYPRE